MVNPPSLALLKLLLALCVFHAVLAGRNLKEINKNPLAAMRCHNGTLLHGNLSINLIWYGKFSASQRAIVSDFVSSISSAVAAPSVSAWWNITEKYYQLASTTATLSLSPVNHILDETCSLGKYLTDEQIVSLAARGGHRNSINAVLTSYDVKVPGFCMNRCGTHGSSPRNPETSQQSFVYIWVGNSESSCPGYCAWPFHKPIYGPQVEPLVSPNNDVGMDGMVISLAGLLAGAVTNPHGNGCFQGPEGAPLEAATACAGVYGGGAYPGYPGNVLIDSETGGSYNARGVNGRKYLLPALYDPLTSSCSTLV